MYNYNIKINSLSNNKKSILYSLPVKIKKDSLNNIKILTNDAKPKHEIFGYGYVFFSNGHYRGTKNFHAKDISSHLNIEHTNKIINEQAKYFSDFPDYYRNSHDDLKDFVMVNILLTNKEKDGLGAKLLAQAVYESLLHGHEGRLILQAANVGEGNPIPFYKKMGLKCCDKELDTKIDEILNKGEKLEDYGLNNLMAGMYLPRENIGYLLRKARSYDLYIKK